MSKILKNFVFHFYVSIVLCSPTGSIQGLTGFKKLGYPFFVVVVVVVFQKNVIKVIKQVSTQSPSFNPTRPRFLIRHIFWKIFNPFHATGVFLYPLKTSENQRFSDVSSGYREKSVA